MIPLDPLDHEGLARNVTLFVFDVDGVLTDGKIVLNDSGEETKNFHVRDGMAISIAVAAGYHVAVISGRRSKVVESRARELKISHVYQGMDNKKDALDSLLAETKLTPHQVAYMGDDINDLAVMGICGFPAAPANADNAVKRKAIWVSTRNGGDGAVREMVQFIMTVQGKWPG